MQLATDFPLYCLHPSVVHIQTKHSIFFHSCVARRFSPLRLVAKLRIIKISDEKISGYDLLQRTIPADFMETIRKDMNMKHFSQVTHNE